MGKEILTFSNTEIQKKKKFTTIRLLFLGSDVDIEKVLASNKIYFGEKKL